MRCRPPPAGHPLSLLRILCFSPIVGLKQYYICSYISCISKNLKLQKLGQLFSSKANMEYMYYIPHQLGVLWWYFWWQCHWAGAQCCTMGGQLSTWGLLNTQDLAVDSSSIIPMSIVCSPFFSFSLFCEHYSSTSYFDRSSFFDG